MERLHHVAARGLTIADSGPTAAAKNLLDMTAVLVETAVAVTSGAREWSGRRVQNPGADVTYVATDPGGRIQACVDATRQAIIAGHRPPDGLQPPEPAGTLSIVETDARGALSAAEDALTQQPGLVIVDRINVDPDALRSLQGPTPVAVAYHGPAPEGTGYELHLSIRGRLLQATPRNGRPELTAINIQRAAGRTLISAPTPQPGPAVPTGVVALLRATQTGPIEQQAAVDLLAEHGLSWPAICQVIRTATTGKHQALEAVGGKLHQLDDDNRHDAAAHYWSAEAKSTQAAFGAL